MGEISTTYYVDIPKIVCSTLNEIGYSNPEQGFDSNSCAIRTSNDEQSQDTTIGVNQLKK